MKGWGRICSFIILGVLWMWSKPFLKCKLKIRQYLSRLNCYLHLSPSGLEQSPHTLNSVNKSHLCWNFAPIKHHSLDGECFWSFRRPNLWFILKMRIVLEDVSYDRGSLYGNIQPDSQLFKSNCRFPFVSATLWPNLILVLIKVVYRSFWSFCVCHKLLRAIHI